MCSNVSPLCFCLLASLVLTQFMHYLIKERLISGNMSASRQQALRNIEALLNILWDKMAVLVNFTATSLELTMDFSLHLREKNTRFSSNIAFLFPFMPLFNSKKPCQTLFNSSQYRVTIEKENNSMEPINLIVAHVYKHAHNNIILMAAKGFYDGYWVYTVFQKLLVLFNFLFI